MSIQTYAVLDNLPPPVTTGTTIQSFTDVLGDVWVAKAGVNGGNWKRARDVLFSRWSRTAALSTAGANIPMDTMYRDDYGLYSTANAWFAPPVAGLYEFVEQVSCGASATGQWGAARLYLNGTLQAIAQSPSTGVAATLSAVVVETIYCNPGDTMITYGNASVTLALGVGGGYWTYAQMKYVGTG
jgi:hypothetical protein